MFIITFMLLKYEYSHLLYLPFISLITDRLTDRPTCHVLLCIYYHLHFACKFLHPLGVNIAVYKVFAF